MREFTASQKQAITTAGKSLTVSAGAGSGKTTVLTERIVHNLLGGTDIDEILVVTFTNAAAADLREKLYSALAEKAAEDVESRRLSDMMLKIPSAKISTVSAFCMRIVRKNFAYLGLSPRLRVCDEAESASILAECLADTEEELLGSGDADFMRLANEFGGEKNFNGLDEMLLKLYASLRARPFWKASLAEACAFHRSQAELCLEKGFTQSVAGHDIMSNTICKLNELHHQSEELYQFICNTAESDKNIRPIAEMTERIETICKHNYENIDALREALAGFSAPAFYGRGMEYDDAQAAKMSKKRITDAFKKLAESFSFTDRHASEDYMRTVELNEAAQAFILRLDSAYTAAKNSRGVCDFADAEQLALKLLAVRTPSGIVRSDVCKRVSAGIREVYVDEYQDINPLQDMIFSLIGRSDNVFRVGDVKQSIYRFRNASAKIFADRVAASPPLPNDGDSARIFLRENFRSTRNIINFVNTIFDKLYTVENTGSSYADERLVCTADGDDPTPVEVMAYTYDKDCGMSRDEIEAKAAAAVIMNSVGRTMKPGGKRLGFGDMAVLVRSATGRTYEYEKVFADAGIPFSTANDSVFLEKPEIQLAVSLLTAIDDPTDGISLAASLRSPVFGFTAEDLRLIREYRPDAQYCECVTACASEYARKTRKASYRCAVPYSRLMNLRAERMRMKRGRRPGIDTLAKCAHFGDIISPLREAAIELPSHGLIRELYAATSLTAIAACSPGGEEKKNNLLSLYRLAVSFEQGSFRGLSAFLAYLRDSGGGIVAPGGGKDSSGCVRLLTFHRSKGLEFPLCIVCGTGTQFNETDTRARFITGGDGFTAFDLKSPDGLYVYKPLFKMGAAGAERREMLREELRCLYVALTRAREKLVITGFSPTGEAPPSDVPFDSLNSNMERILYALDGVPRSGFYVFHEPTAAIPPAKPHASWPVSLTPTGKEPEWREYRHNDACRAAAKVSVSELRKGLLEDDEYERTVAAGSVLMTPVFATGGAAASAEIGTATHKFMQFCDFNSAEADGVQAEAKRLCAAGLILPREAELIRFDEVTRFLGSELYRAMRSSPDCRREMRFTLTEDSSVIGGAKGETVLIQGVIDCFFRGEDGGWTVVDYKTDRVSGKTAEADLIRRHGAQLAYYRRAVEEMTGDKVKAAVLWSFSLEKALKC